MRSKPTAIDLIALLLVTGFMICVALPGCAYTDPDIGRGVVIEGPERVEPATLEATTETTTADLTPCTVGAIAR